MKRVNPDNLVVTYQGDGDAYSIGIAESMNAAYRNENITVITINNTNLGMTGGQMSWTTMEGQKTTTSKYGRDCAVTGYPTVSYTHLGNAIAAISMSGPTSRLQDGHLDEKIEKVVKTAQAISKEFR